MMNINQWILRNRIIRRIIVFSLLTVFLKVTLNIFNDSMLDVFRVSAYGIFGGLITLILKFYLQSKKEEVEGD